MTLSNLWLETVVKHLPPSGATLHLLDLSGMLPDALTERRPDIERVPHAANAVDAVVSLGGPDDALLESVIHALRPGGRLLILDPDGAPTRESVEQLEHAGFIRILAEPLDPAGTGLLLRGERPHTTDDTLARVRQAADRSVPALDAFRGRYVHLLVRQHPNRPAWAVRPDDVVTWKAISTERDGKLVALAFSSLPNAVAFMQRAVLAGTLTGISKVARFTRETASGWPFPIWLNPPPDSDMIWGEIPVDPATAVASDE